MNLSKRSEYAVRVMVDVAMAAARGRRLVSLAALAEAQKISPAFLEQILSSLRQAHFLTSTRGKMGGYSLARSADEIQMSELLEFLEGPLVSAACVAGAKPGCMCPDPERCGLRWMLERIRTALSGVMDGLTLGEVARQTLGRCEADGFLPPILRQEWEGSGQRKKLSAGRGRRGESEPEYLI